MMKPLCFCFALHYGGNGLKGTKRKVCNKEGKREYLAQVKVRFLALHLIVRTEGLERLVNLYSQVGFLWLKTILISLNFFC